MSIPGLTAGRRTYWASDLAVRRWTDDERVTVGAFCSIAEDVVFICGGGHRTSTVSTWPMDQNFGGKPDAESRSYKQGKSITIGNDVWIATGAMVMPGVTIGDGAVIHPGAVVFDYVAPYTVVRGNPAKAIRKRFDPDVIQALLRIKWWDWTDEDIALLRDDFYGDVRDFMEKYDR